MEPLPSLHAEGAAARVIQELGLGVGERLPGTVLTDLGAGRYEVRLGGRVVKVQSQRPLEPGGALLLSVRETRSRLVLEILDHRPAVPPAPDEALGGRLKSLGLPDEAPLREALGVLLEQGVPVSRANLEALLEAAREHPASQELARRAAAFLLSASAEGKAPSPEQVNALVQALKGGALSAAQAAFEGLGIPFLALEGGWEAGGPGQIAQALVRLEQGLRELLARDPALRSLDLALGRLAAEPGPGKPGAEELAARLLAVPAGPDGEALAARLLEGMDDGMRRAVAGLLQRQEREVLGRHPDVLRFREAAQALDRARLEEAGRLLLGREGVRYAEGVFRPPEGGRAERLRVSARSGGGKGKGRGPLSVAVVLNLSALGEVGALLVTEDGGKRLEITLRASSPEAEGLLREGASRLSGDLRTLGYEATVGVVRTGESPLGFHPELGTGRGPAPLVDLKA